MNMSYCRFENTANDLRDCRNNLPFNNLSKEEAAAFAKLVMLCREFTAEYQECNFNDLISLSVENPDNL